jgi:hypothetical protein
MTNGANIQYNCQQYYVAYQVKEVKFNNQVGLALGSSPPYEFDIKPHLDLNQKKEK